MKFKKRATLNIKELKRPKKKSIRNLASFGKLKLT